MCEQGSTRPRTAVSLCSACILLAAFGLATGCEPNRSDPIATTRAAVQQPQTLELTLYSPPEAPRLGEYVANAKIEPAPTNQEHVARLRDYLSTAAAMEKEWKAAGKGEPEIKRLRAELKTDMLRDGSRP